MSMPKSKMNKNKLLSKDNLLTKEDLEKQVDDQLGDRGAISPESVLSRISSQNLSEDGTRNAIEPRQSIDV